MVPIAAAAAPSLMSTLGPAVIGGMFGLGGSMLGQSASAKEAAKQRDWMRQSQHMAHQWEVADLRAAGLNPILSGTGGGGATGGSGAMGQVPDFAGAMSSGAKSGLETKRLWRELQNMAAGQDNTEQDTELKKTQREREGEQALQLKELSKLLRQQLETEKGNTARAHAEAKIAASGVPGAQIEADIDTGVQGEITRRIKRVIDLIPGLGNLLRKPTVIKK